MKHLPWFALFLATVLSNFINTFVYDFTQPLIPMLLKSLGVNPYIAISLHIILSNLLAAVVTVLPFAFLMPGRPILVPSVLALPPFISWGIIYTNNYVLEPDQKVLFVLVMGLTLVVIPLFYFYSYRSLACMKYLVNTFSKF